MTNLVISRQNLGSIKRDQTEKAVILRLEGDSIFYSKTGTGGKMFITFPTCYLQARVRDDVNII